MKERGYLNYMESVLDAKTIDDLELDEIFHTIDFSFSAIGSQILFFNLLSPKKSIDEIKEMESEISLIKKKSYTQFKKALSKFNKNSHYKTPSLFFENIKFDFGFLQIIPITVSVLIIAILTLLVFKSTLLIIGIVILALFNSSSYFILKYKFLSHIERVTIYRDFQNLIFSLKKIDTPHLNIIQSSNSKFLLKFLTYLTDQRTSPKNIVITEVETLVNSVMEIFLSIFCIDFFIIKFFDKKITNEKDEIHHNYLEIGKVDFLLSIIELRDKKKVCIPKYNVSQLSFEGMVHPLIQEYKPLSFNDFTDANIILGSNMSGKTVLIKTLAINCLLFRCLNTVFSNSFTSNLYIPFSLFEPGKDYSNTKSYFKKEILRFNEAFKKCNSGHKYLFLIDEPLKGTNHQFSTAINCALLSEMAKYTNAKLFIASHSFKTSEILKQQHSFQVFYMSEKIFNNDVIYDYTIHLGTPNTYNPIQTILNGIFPKKIISLAEDYYDYLIDNNNNKTQG